jgi:hypothetical protein
MVRKKSLPSVKPWSKFTLLATQPVAAAEPNHIDVGLPPAPHILLLLLVAGLLFFAGLGRLPLLEPDEGRNAEVAREMLLSGDWITPHFNNLPYLDKPVAFFWLVAAAFRLLGVSEWTARLPSALMGLATLLLTWHLARRMFGNSTALRAGVVVATCPLVIAFARLVIFDMTLACLVTLAMLSFWSADSGGYNRPWCDILMFLAMGLATITKGPVGFLLPLLSIVTFQAMRGRLAELKRLRWSLGMAAFLASVLPWFIAVSLRNPDFPHYALWQESLQRFATGHAHRRGSILYYLPVYLGGFLPWSLFLLLAGLGLLKKWRELRDEKQKPALFLVSWTVVILVFFTISHSKLPGYFLPAIVPLSILMAKVWEEVEAEGACRAPRWLIAGFWCLLGIAVLITVSPYILRLPRFETTLAGKIHPSVLGLFSHTLLMTGLILLALSVLGRNLAARLRGRRLSLLTFVLLAAAVPVLIIRWRTALVTYVVTSSSQRLAQRILSSPDRNLEIYGYYYFRTSLPFYLRRRVGLVTTNGNELTSNYIASKWVESRQRTRSPGQESGPPAPSTPWPLGAVSMGPMMDGAAFDELLRTSTKPLLVMVRNTHVAEMAQKAGRMESLWGAWEYSVWRIPAAKPGDFRGGDREWSVLPCPNRGTANSPCWSRPAAQVSLAPLTAKLRNP